MTREKLVLWIEGLYNQLQRMKNKLFECEFVMVRISYLDRTYLVELTDKALTIVQDDTAQGVHFDLQCDKGIWNGQLTDLEKVVLNAD